MFLLPIIHQIYTKSWLSLFSFTSTRWCCCLTQIFPTTKRISSILQQTRSTVLCGHQRLKMNSSWQLCMGLTFYQPQYTLPVILVLEGKTPQSKVRTTLKVVCCLAGQYHEGKGSNTVTLDLVCVFPLGSALGQDYSPLLFGCITLGSIIKNEVELQPPGPKTHWCKVSFVFCPCA